MDKPQLTKADIKKACDVLRMDDGVGANNYIEQLSWLLFLKIFENIEEELKELSENGKYVDIVDSEYKWSSWAKKDWKDKDELVFFINQKLFPYLRGLKGTSEKEKVSEIFREITNRIHSSSTILDTIDILDKIKMEHFQDTHLLSQVYEEILQEMGSEGGWSGEFYTPRPIIRLMIKIVNPKLGDVILDPFVGSAGFLVESFDYLQKNNSKMGIKEWESLQRKTFYGQEKKPLPYLIGMMNMILHRILVPNLTRTNTLMEDVHNMPESQKVDVILTNPPFGGKENKSVQENYPIPSEATEALALQYVMRRLKNGGSCGLILPDLNIMFGDGAVEKIRRQLLEIFNVHTIISLPAGAFAQMGTSVKTNLIFFDKTGPTKEIWYGEIKGKFTKKKIVQDEHVEEIFNKWKKREVSDNSWIVPIENIKERGYDLSPKNPIFDDIDSNLSPGEIIKEIKNCQEEVNNLLDLINDDSGTAKQTFDGVEKELSEILSYEQPTKYIVKSVNYDDSNKTPVLTAGKTFILGYTNEKEGIFEEELPVIIFDDFTTAIKFVDFPFKVKSSAMKILHADKDKVNIRYLFLLMQNITFSVRKHKRHWISEYSKIKVRLPSLEVQNKITAELEEKITLLKKLNDLIEQQKKAIVGLRISYLNQSFKEEI